MSDEVFNIFNGVDADNELDLGAQCKHSIFTPHSFFNYIRNTFGVYENIAVTITIKRERAGQNISSRAYVSSSTDTEMYEEYEVHDYKSNRIYNIKPIDMLNRFSEFMTCIAYDEDDDGYYVSEDPDLIKRPIIIYENAIPFSPLEL